MQGPLNLLLPLPVGGHQTGGKTSQEQGKERNKTQTQFKLSLDFVWEYVYEGIWPSDYDRHLDGQNVPHFTGEDGHLNIKKKKSVYYSYIENFAQYFHNF